MRLPDLLAPAHEPAIVQDGPALRRRRITVVLTIAVGTALLAATLRVRPGTAQFSALGFLVAVTWIAGGLLSGPIPVRPASPVGPARAFSPGGRSRWIAVVLAALLLGGVAFLGFLAADLVGQQISWVASALSSVLGKADTGPRAVVLVIALVNAVGEEVFFRGALHAALEPRRPAVVSTVIYIAVTAASGNIALVVAAAVMGTIFSLERLSTQSILASVVTHLSWSALIFFLLPR
jgi:membrane protease YdiL (CAAX protease family)